MQTEQTRSIHYALGYKINPGRLRSEMMVGQIKDIPERLADLFKIQLGQMFGEQISKALSAGDIDLSIKLSDIHSRLRKELF